MPEAISGHRGPDVRSNLCSADNANILDFQVARQLVLWLNNLGWLLSSYGAVADLGNDTQKQGGRLGSMTDAPMELAYYADTPACLDAGS